VTTHPFLIVCAAIALAVLLWVAAVFAVVLATDTIVWQALDYLLTTAGA
jgi:type IV secretory pathway TrbD component